MTKVNIVPDKDMDMIGRYLGIPEDGPDPQRPLIINIRESLYNSLSEDMRMAIANQEFINDYNDELEAPDREVEHVSYPEHFLLDFMHERLEQPASEH